ncbi:unnamed protein product [Spodoptera exigua]|nr:unnamed protein product [Spodoptera exigua]
MATLEDEIRDLKEKNNELVQKVQFWKLAAAKKEDEKLTLMKEVNELRLKLSMLRNHGSTQAKKLDSALQEASEKAIAHLVNASAEIAKSVEIAKAYMREREELEEQLPRWSTLGGTPRAENTERVHRVAPMMMEGRCVQPVVELNRTILLRGESGSGDTTERAVPLHMLQDVYIPLTRIDISDFAHPTVEVEANMDTANDIISEEYIEGYGPPGVPVPIHRGQRRRERRERRDRRERRERTADHAAEAYEQHAGQHYEEHVEQHQERQEQHYQENDEQHYSVQAEQHYDGQHEQHYDGQEGQHYDGEPNQHYDEQNLDSSEPMSEGNEYNIKLEPVSEEERAVMAETQSLFNRISMQLQDDSWGQQGFETIEESPEESHQASLMNSTAYDNPLEGPSWLLDRTPTATRTSTTSHTPGNRHEPTLRSGKNLTPGSTTDKNRTPNTSTRNTDDNIPVELSPAQATFSPTVRRRKRTSSPPPLATPRQPHYSPRPSSSRRNSRSSLNGRVLKVLVAKMRLDGSPLSLSPPKQARSPRSLPFDAPSPNGATDSRVIVSSSHQLSRVGSQESRDSGAVGRRGRPDSRASRDSDSGSSGAGGSVSEGRTRRPRKAITYKEKPLNRKLRR